MALVDDLPYRPFGERGHVVDGEFRWRLGARPLDLDRWFEFGDDGEEWVAEKAGIMNDHAGQAFAVIPDAEPECREVAEAIAAHLDVELDPVLHPLDAAARHVPDDLVVMVQRDGRLVFGGGSVCFPNRWDLPSKLGLTMAEVHAPVAGLNDQLGRAVDDFLVRLTPDRSYWRLGWGLIDSLEGFEPPRHRPGRSFGPTDLAVRVERETLRRFPQTGCVLFGIRTYLTPLPAASRDGDLAAAVAGIVDAMPPPVRQYKDLEAIGDEVVGWLRQRSQ